MSNWTSPEKLIEVSHHIWQEACNLASTVVASERLAFHSAHVARQESQRELTGLADILAQQVDELTLQVENLQSALGKTGEARAWYLH